MSAALLSTICPLAFPCHNLVSIIHCPGDSFIKQCVGFIPEVYMHTNADTHRIIWFYKTKLRNFLLFFCTEMMVLLDELEDRKQKTVWVMCKAASIMHNYAAVSLQYLYVNSNQTDCFTPFHNDHTISVSSTPKSHFKMYISQVNTFYLSCLVLVNLACIMTRTYNDSNIIMTVAGFVYRQSPYESRW